MTPFDAFHLPGFDADRAGVQWAELQAGAMSLRYPILDAAAFGGICNSLRENRMAVLSRRSVHDVIRSVDAVAHALAAPGELRDQALALLPEASRLSAPMVELILDRMAADWRAPALERLVRAELGDPAALDGFVDDAVAGRRVRAVGPRLTLNVFAGNVPGVAVTAIVRCLLVKSATLGKTAADDPVLPVLFARALARVDPELASCVAVTYWPGGTGAAEDEALRQVDAVVVYGGAEAVRAVRSRAPGSTRVLEHGPRISFGFIAREALTAPGARALARGVALAAATFDQHGCVSLHGAFVERGGAVEPRAFARLVFDELTALESSLPAGRLLPDEAARLHAERGRAEFEQMAIGGEVMAGGGAATTVVYSEQPDATPSCLDRFVRICAVEDVADGLPALGPLDGLLQTAALAAGPERRSDLADRLAEAGFTRITGFGAMPWPPAHWHHDGAAPLRELIRWVDLEAESGG